jgi:predicted secreted protein
MAAFITAQALPAGDVASFVDLGFSADGAIYMFGEYGIEGATLRPWANLNIVDVRKNDFVTGGRLVYKHNDIVAAGHDGEGALLAIVGQNPAITKLYGMSYLKQGVPLYVSLLEGHTAGGEAINFRDFDRGATYRASLISLTEGSGRNVWSSFYINVERTDRDGTKKTYRVGSPEIKRTQVTSYSIKKVSVKPETDALIFVIEMRLPLGSGPDIRYMVEALSMK